MKRVLILIFSMMATLVSCTEIRDLNYYSNGYVDDVTLNANSVELVLGKDRTFQLKATISPITAPNRKVIWTSSNWSVVEVNESGLLTPKSVGKAVITVKTDDGGYKDECDVTVVAAAQDNN